MADDFFGQGQLFQDDYLYPERTPFSQYNPAAGIDVGNPLANMVLMMAAQQGLSGQIGLGVGPVQYGSLSRNLRKQYESARHMRVVSQAASADVQPVMDTLQGLAAMTDIQRSLDDKFRSRMAQFMKVAAPMSPDIADMLTGGRSLTAMTSAVSLATRNQYDPETRALGYSDASVSTLSGQLYRAYGFDVGTGTQEARGFSAGQIGKVYDVLSSRGLLGGIQKEAQQMPDGETLTTMNIDKIKGKMDEYTKALSVIREIFGDAGQPDAPVAKLFQALETISGGSIYNTDAGAVGRQIRDLREAASAANVDFGVAMRLTADASRERRGLGLVGNWELMAATQSLDLKTAFETGQVLKDPMWGRATPQEMTMLRDRLSVAQAASPIGRFMGAAQRTRDIYGENEKLDSWIASWKEGEMPEELMGLSEVELTAKLAETAGVSEQVARQFLDQTVQNEEALRKLGPGAIRAADRITRKELINTMIGQPAQSIIGEEIRTQVGGATGTEVTGLSDRLTEAFTQSIEKADLSVLADTQKREEYLAKALETAAEAAASQGDTTAKALLDQLEQGPGGRAGGLRSLAARAYGQADEEFKWQYGQTLATPLTILSPEVLEATSDLRVRRAIRAAADEATTGYSSGIVTKAIANLQSAGKDVTQANLKDYLKNTLGVMNDEQADSIASTMAGMYEQRQVFDEEKQKLEADLMQMRKEGVAAPDLQREQERRLESMKQRYNIMTSELQKLEKVIGGDEEVRRRVFNVMPEDMRPALPKEWGEEAKKKTDDKAEGKKETDDKVGYVDGDQATARQQVAATTTDDGRLLLSVQTLNINGKEVLKDGDADAEYYSGRGRRGVSPV